MKVCSKSLLLLAGFLLTASSVVQGAGAAAATSGYLTIQPNAASTGYVYTYSWVAPDTNNSGDGSTYTDTRFVNPFGNGNASVDNINTTGGTLTLTDDPANHPSGYTIKYAGCMSTAGDNTTPPNIAGKVYWQEPLNTTIGYVAPTVATPKHDSIGDFTTMPSFYLISGVQGVAGIYGAAPDGSDALAAGSAGAIHQGIGFGVDDDGIPDDFGPIIAGFDAVLDTTPTNTMPNTGYVRVEVPFGTAGNDFTTRFNTGIYTGNGANEVVVTTTPEGTYTAKLAVSGDFNSTLSVDGADLTIGTTGFGGTSVTGKWYANGDTDADGDVDNADLGAVIGAFSVGSGAGTGADLIYDSALGTITLDATNAPGGVITSFQLEDDSGSFIPGNYASLGGTFGFEDATADVLGDTDATLVGFSGPVSLGAVLPVGLDLAGLQSLLSTAVYTGVAGTGQQTFGLQVVTIPEPASLALLALGGLLSFRRRRRT